MQFISNINKIMVKFQYQRENLLTEGGSPPPPTATCLILRSLLTSGLCLIGVAPGAGVPPMVLTEPGVP